MHHREGQSPSGPNQPIDNMSLKASGHNKPAVALRSTSAAGHERIKKRVAGRFPTGPRGSLDIFNSHCRRRDLMREAERPPSIELAYKQSRGGADSSNKPMEAFLNASAASTSA